MLIKAWVARRLGAPPAAECDKHRLHTASASAAFCAWVKPLAVIALLIAAASSTLKVATSTIC